MKVKINQLAGILKKAVQNDQRIPLMFWSGPGIGKSSVVKQVADELGWKFIDLRLSMLNAVDLRGLPHVDKDKNTARWLPPEFLPKEDGSKGILFLDEINLAPASVMHAGYQLILDGRLGEYVLPKTWKIVAAGNRSEDNANVTKFPSPLANRFVHVEVEHDIDVWRKWAIGAGINEMVISFLGKFPQHLYKQPKAGELAFNTPRSWEMASRLLDAKLDISFAVGDGLAAEFNAFIKVYDRMPDVDKVLAGTETKCPKEVDVQWALSTAIMVRVTEAQVPVIMKYVDNFSTELQVLTILNIAGKSPKHQEALLKCKEWKDWSKKNSALIEAGSE